MIDAITVYVAIFVAGLGTGIAAGLIIDWNAHHRGDRD
jgi:hypothetical protein